MIESYLVAILLCCILNLGLTFLIAHFLNGRKNK